MFKGGSNIICILRGLWTFMYFCLYKARRFINLGREDGRGCRSRTRQGQGLQEGRYVDRNTPRASGYGEPSINLTDLKICSMLHPLHLNG